MSRDSHLKYRPRPYDTVISNYTSGERVTIIGYSEWNLSLDQIIKYGRISWNFSTDYIEVVKLYTDTKEFNKRNTIVEPITFREETIPHHDIEEYVTSKIPIVDQVIEKRHWWQCC